MLVSGVLESAKWEFCTTVCFFPLFDQILENERCADGLHALYWLLGA